MLSLHRSRSLVGVPQSRLLTKVYPVKSLPSFKQAEMYFGPQGSACHANIFASRMKYYFCNLPFRKEAQGSQEEVFFFLEVF